MWFTFGFFFFKLRKWQRKRQLSLLYRSYMSQTDMLDPVWQNTSAQHHFPDRRPLSLYFRVLIAVLYHNFEQNWSLSDNSIAIQLHSWVRSKRGFYLRESGDMKTMLETRSSRLTSPHPSTHGSVPTEQQDEGSVPFSTTYQSILLVTPQHLNWERRQYDIKCRVIPPWSSF